jgi:hypothetical protein
MASEETLASTSINLKPDRLSTEANYDAVLTRTTVGVVQFKLTLQLRLFMQQINPPTALPPTMLDSDRKPFWIVPWTSTAWQKFLAEVQRQANLWNDRFWLKTPADVTDYDLKAITPSGGAYHPYIKCCFDLSFVPHPGYAHATLEVANLNLDKKLNADLNGFRSNSVLWCSQDVNPQVYVYPIETGVLLPHIQATIAHELGHRLGLPHIGVIKKSLLCELAIMSDPKDGSNSLRCYGWDQPYSDADNIMGAGMAFTAEDALPWLWAIKQLRMKPWEAWPVVTAFPGYSYPTPGPGRVSW